MKFFKLLAFSLLFVSTFSFSQRMGIQNYADVLALQNETLISKPSDKVFVVSINELFYWNASSVTVHDGISVIKQNNVVTGRFLKVGAGVQNFSFSYGRVNALTDLASTTFLSTGIGTKVPFNATVYNSGISFVGTDGFTPVVSGRYRVSWFMIGGSGQFAGDGSFHVVQNGISLGSVFVDMMEAAGVNQTTPFLDVNLVAGQTVNLYYQGVVSDALIWQKGSYLDICQLSGFLPVNFSTTSISGIVPIVSGGTGSATQNFVDLTTAQTVLGNKTFNGNTLVGSVAGNTTTIGNNSGAVSINAGTGAIGIATDANNGTVNISTGLGGRTVNLGNANSTSSINISAGASGTTRFLQNGLEKMRVHTNGFVGVGTATPINARLEIEGNDNTAVTASAGVHSLRLYNAVNGANSATRLRFQTTNTTNPFDIQVNNASNTTFGGATSVNFVNYSANPVTWFTGTTPTEKMRLTGAGLLGIGNVTPTRTLDVTGTVGVSSNLQVATTNALENVNINAGLKFYGGTLSSWGSGTQGGIDASGGLLRLQGASGLQFVYGTGGGVSASIGSTGTFTHSALTVFSGNVQFGSTPIGSIGIRFGTISTFNYVSPYGFLTSSGTTGTNNAGSGSINWSFETDGRILTAGEIDVKSDRRAKTDIHIFDGKRALEFVNKVNAKSYRWNDGRADKLTKIGFIAQDIGKAGLGEAVTLVKGKIRNDKGELVEVDDFHVLDKNQLLSVLWSAVREQQKQIEKLKVLVKHK